MWYGGSVSYCMTTTSDGGGSRQHLGQELKSAHFQDKLVTEIAIFLHGKGKNAEKEVA